MEIKVLIVFIIGSNPNYEPNTRNNGKNTFLFRPEVRYAPYRVTGLVQRIRPSHPDDDFVQPTTLYRKVWTDKERNTLIHNLTLSMKGVRQDIAERVIKMFYLADAELGTKLGQNLGVPAIQSRL
jgi:catalase